MHIREGVISEFPLCVFVLLVKDCDSCSIGDLYHIIHVDVEVF